MRGGCWDERGEWREVSGQGMGRVLLEGAWGRAGLEAWVWV